MIILMLFDATVVALSRSLDAARSGLGRDRGQTTAEYALVLLGAASVALILVAWAAKSGKIGELFDAVVDGIIDKL